MSLRRSVLSGLFWAGGTRLIGQALTWAITIVVIRLLSPDDYGLLAMAMVFVNLLFLLAEAGLGAALVQAPKADEPNLRAIFAAIVLVDFALFALLIASAPAIAHFFDEDRLTLIIRILALQFLISIFAVIPTALLTRALDFKHQSVIGLAAAFCGSVTTLVLALSGYGVWALIIGNLTAHLLNTVGINLVSPFLKWPDFSLRGARQLLVIGGQMTAARVLWFIYSQADIFIAGRLLGKELLGFYSVSMHLASRPVQRISAVINQVAFPAFARSQHDPELVSRYLLKALRLLFFVSFPVLWGISSIAPEIVGVLLGAKWSRAVVPLQLLPLIMPLSIVSPFLNTAFQGIGHSGVVFRNTLTACLIMPAAFCIGANWGLVGLSLAWVVGFPIVLAFNLRRMLPLVALNLRDVFSVAAPALLGSCGMYAAVTITRHFAADRFESAVLMLVLIGVGATSYAALAWTANRTGVGELADLLNVHRLWGKQA